VETTKNMAGKHQFPNGETYGKMWANMGKYGKSSIDSLRSATAM
jgi:hypothetical protein